MRRLVLSVVLSFMVVSAGATPPSWADDSEAGTDEPLAGADEPRAGTDDSKTYDDVAEAIAEARPAEPSTSKLDYLLELKKAIDKGLKDAGPIKDAFPNVKAMSYLAALPLVPAGFGHADAINGEIIEQTRWGF